MVKVKKFLEDNLKVYCTNRGGWETDKLRFIPSGDFVDNKGSIHSAKNHIPFVLYGASLTALDIVKEEAIEALSKVLGNWVHGGDADCIIAEFEELLTKNIEKVDEK